MTNARINAHTGIWVGHTSILIMPNANIDAKTMRYHHSGTEEQDRSYQFCTWRSRGK